MAPLPAYNGNRNIINTQGVLQRHYAKTKIQRDAQSLGSLSVQDLNPVLTVRKYTFVIRERW